MTTISRIFRSGRPSLSDSTPGRYLSTSAFSTASLPFLDSEESPSTASENHRRLQHQTHPLPKSRDESENQLISLIKSCSKKTHLLQIHAHIIRTSLIQNHFISLQFLSRAALSPSRDMGYSSQVFSQIMKPSGSQYNVMIRAYSMSHSPEQGFYLYREMRRRGVPPNPLSSSFVMKSCIRISSLMGGLQIHARILRDGHQSDNLLLTTLMDLYSCCDKFEEACKSTADGFEPDDVTCLLLLQACANLGALEFEECSFMECNDSGFAMHGYGREAIEAFEQMQQLGVSPDDQTLTGVLSACSHCGLVDDGLMFFDRMSKVFGIEPNIHHYGCMVDLLGRAGLLDQAYQLIMSMVIKPDSTLWRTLLGACRIHRHATLGERVIGHLIELKAQEAGDYVLLLNIYSSVGKVHEFVVDDILHPRTDEIYEMLDEIGKQLKIAGYVAELSSELHNLGAEEKGNRLSYHSEKLAIAFGVLATPPGTTIRVAKNLRIVLTVTILQSALAMATGRDMTSREDILRRVSFEGGLQFYSYRTACVNHGKEVSPKVPKSLCAEASSDLYHSFQPLYLSDGDSYPTRLSDVTD
ncbi:Pentatricopeptide repeat-containing protein [Vitis vinifera]|uniref:Pentatricopeptide repeat-containing protein n=1 Tax=Vitis vinifera TaxID=29760 RepID=A0A438BM47_VITVI|nr:Pentatricopeptide repeat-containing protein [Vitis vinifera]